MGPVVGVGATWIVDADWIPPLRRDASLLPHITRVDNPYAIPEATVDVVPGPSGSGISPAMPSEEWRSVLEGRFKNLKKVRVPGYTLKCSPADNTLEYESTYDQRPSTPSA